MIEPGECCRWNRLSHFYDAGTLNEWPCFWWLGLVTLVEITIQLVQSQFVIFLEFQPEIHLSVTICIIGDLS